MAVIEGTELKPCKELYTKTDADGKHINLLTHCNHSMCDQGCLDGRGVCVDYEIAERIAEGIRCIANQVAVRE